MLEKLKKKSIKKSLSVILIPLVMGLMMIAFCFSALKAQIRGPVKFESLAPDEITNGLIVDVTLYDNLGCYMEEYLESSNTPINITTSLYYVIWTGDDEADDYRYIGIKVPASDKKAMENMAEATYYGYEYSDPISYSGVIMKMPSKEYKYFYEYFEEGGFTADEIDDWILPYYIYVDTYTESYATPWVISGIGAVLVLIAVILLILVFTGSKLKAFKKELMEIGIDEASAGYDYENAVLFHNESDLRVGHRLTFFIVGSKPHVIANNKLVWAYQSTTTHRTNGIKTGTTYAVRLCTLDKKSFLVSVSNETQAQEALQYISEHVPGAIVGYDDNLSKTFQNDFQNFLQLKYNQSIPNDFFQM